MEPAYELIVYGASGYTGREALAHLASRAERIGLSWAIAGRDRAKLERLAAGLDGAVPGVLVAAAGDRRSEAELARSGAALISFLGPHAPLGDDLLEECVAAGCEYADLCGENDVIAARVRALHRPARAAGVKLISACGYESVPFDLAVLGLDRAFRAADGSRLAEAEAEVRFLFHRSPLRYGHGNSGGTLATVARLVEAPNLTDPTALARAAGAERRSDPVGLEARRSAAGEWLAPLLPTPFLNPAVIALSDARLAESEGGYAEGFTYRESLNLSASLGSRALGGPAAKASSSLLRRIAAMSRGRRTLGDRLALAALAAASPAAGRGPRRSTLDTIDYEIALAARSDSGIRARGTVRGSGHPGYRSAAAILAEAGIALARDPDLPEGGGVLTPAGGLGWGFASALAAAGVRFEIEPAGVDDGAQRAGRDGAAAERG